MINLTEFIEGDGYEARPTLKEQPNLSRYTLEGPRLCTYVCSYYLNTKQTTFVSCARQLQGQKSEQKHTTKKLVRFHNHSPLFKLWMAPTKVELDNEEYY